jgi:hypothetical protein
MTLAKERYQEDRDIWYDCNHRQEFEHDLINRKTTWSLTAQTILFTAYGLSNVGGKFRYAIAISGLATAIVIFIGILALINSKYQSWKMYKDFYESCPDQLPLPLLNLQWGVETRNTWRTLLPDLSLPVIFAVAWIVILV